MSISEDFTDDLAVSVGNPTKASDYNTLSNNTDALKERFDLQHHFNNSPLAADGYHKEIEVLIQDAAAASVKTGLTVTWNPDSGSLGAGSGVGISVKLDDASGGQAESATIEWVYTDATSGSEDLDLSIKLMKAGTLTEAIKILGTGGLEFPDATTLTSGSVIGVDLNGDTNNKIIIDADADTYIYSSGTDDQIFFSVGNKDKIEIFGDGSNEIAIMIDGTSANASRAFDAANGSELALYAYSEWEGGILVHVGGSFGHGMTDILPTKCAGGLVPTATDGLGGVYNCLSLVGLGADKSGLMLMGYGGSGDTAKNSSSLAPVSVWSGKKSSADGAELGANENILVLGTASNIADDTYLHDENTKHVFDADGDYHYDGTVTDASDQAFDHYDDIALMRTLTLAMGGNGIIDHKFDEHLRGNEPLLVELGILGDTLENGGLVNMTRHTKLMNDGIVQLAHRQEDVNARLERKNKRLQARVRKLENIAKLLEA